MPLPTEKPLPPFIEGIYHPYYPKFSFQIALVALRLKHELHLVPVDPNQQCGLWKIEDRYLKNVKTKYIEAIKAVNPKVKIICFGEMTYPWSKNPEENQKFQEILCELSKRRNLYIIAGSYHDFTANPGKRYNTCMIFTPQKDTPYIQHKLRSAVKANECCDVPRPYITVVGTPYGNFVVPICIDVGNEDIKAKIKYLNYYPKYRGIQFVISPAFDPDLTVINHAEALSRTYEICVAFLNSFEDTQAGRSEPPIFFKSGGHSVTAFAKKKNIYIYNVSSEDCKPPTQVFPVSS